MTDAKELVKAGQSTGLLAQMKNMLAMAEQAADQQMADTGTNLGSYLTFSGKTGEWNLDGAFVEEGTEFLFDFFSMKKGIICWNNERATGKELVSSFDPKAVIPEIPAKELWNKGDRWNNLLELEVVSLDTFKRSTFNISAGGGVRALTKAFKDWSDKVRMNLDSDGGPKVCIVAVGGEKKKGKDAEGQATTYYVPTFTISAFATEAEIRGTDTASEVETTPVQEAPKAPAKRVGFGSGVRGVRV